MTHVDMDRAVPNIIQENFNEFAYLSRWLGCRRLSCAWLLGPALKQLEPLLYVPVIGK